MLSSQSSPLIRETIDLLRSMAVIGAAGKMGRGISLLLLELQAEQLLLKKNENGFYLYLIDASDEALTGLYHYLKNQIKKSAEKKMELLQAHYRLRPELLNDKLALIATYADDVISHIRSSTVLENAKKAQLVFEAAIENLTIKKELFSRLNSICSPETFYFTNTSSIPISELEKSTGLSGRLMGVHFYNPPPIQKLVEIITTKQTPTHLLQLVSDLGKMMKKILIPSQDVAGFIGNGHFIRDGLYAISQIAQHQTKFPFPATIYLVNKISQDFLLRPMGIFQLIDYVGIDVFYSILKVMRENLKDDKLSSSLIENLLEFGIKGGQYPDGSQKEGFFEYQQGKIIAVYDINSKRYVPLSLVDWPQEVDDYLGTLPEDHKSWHQLIKDPQKNEFLKNYFQELFTMNSVGAQLSQDYLLNSKRIAEHLYHSGVANSPEDINGVLINGFYHLYGPINTYCHNNN